MALLDLISRRLVIVTGKGGVGKTTFATAMARALARKGRRVLVAEVSPNAETPSQVTMTMGGPALTEEPQAIAQDMWGVLLTPTIGHKRFLQDTLPLKLFADAAMKSQGVRRFLAAAPGFSDMGVMYRMLDLMKQLRPDGGLMFETAVIDSPATGHALALAQIPELLTRVIPAGPIFRAAREGMTILTDPHQTATVVVTLPETLPVTESLELREGLKKHRMTTAAIVINRVPPDPFSKEERETISAVVAGKSVFGRRELQRIDRADAAVKLLGEKAPGGFVTLPELAETGAELSERLAGFISGQG